MPSYPSRLAAAEPNGRALALHEQNTFKDKSYQLLVNDVVALIGLTKVRNVVIGNAEVRGISGMGTLLRLTPNPNPRPNMILPSVVPAHGSDLGCLFHGIYISASLGECPVLLERVATSSTYHLRTFRRGWESVTQAGSASVSTWVWSWSSSHASSSWTNPPQVWVLGGIQSSSSPQPYASISQLRGDSYSLFCMLPYRPGFLDQREPDQHPLLSQRTRHDDHRDHSPVRTDRHRPKAGVPASAQHN